MYGFLERKSTSVHFAAFLIFAKLGSRVFEFRFLGAFYEFPDFDFAFFMCYAKHYVATFIKNRVPGYGFLERKSMSTPFCAFKIFAKVGLRFLEFSS